MCILRSVRSSSRFATFDGIDRPLGIWTHSTLTQLLKRWSGWWIRCVSFVEKIWSITAHLWCCQILRRLAMLLQLPPPRQFRQQCEVVQTKPPKSFRAGTFSISTAFEAGSNVNRVARRGSFSSPVRLAVAFPGLIFHHLFPSRNAVAAQCCHRIKHVLLQQPYQDLSS